MSLSSHFSREAEPTGHTLGLGWLLAFSLGGAVLLFTCIGLLLSWRIKNRPENETTTTIYEVADRENPGRKLGFTKRLTKRKYVMAQSTSRLSLSLPPIIPPMPTYQSFGFGNRKRSRSWVEEDKFHGPKVSKSFRNSWLKRDSWLGKAPTLPSLMLDDTEKGSFDDILDIHGQQRDSNPPPPPPLPTSQTAPELPTQDFVVDDTPPRVQLPVLALMRPSITDTDLHDILRSTEMRLRDGHSVSPVKTPNGSPSKRSPSKTPRSQKTNSSQGSIKSIGTVGTVGTVRITRMSISPGKRATVQSIASHTHTHSRNASISSIGSAAQSLIAEATQELVLSGALPSPNRPRVQQWETEEEKIDLDDVSPRGRTRTRSLESDQSSSLSTVYSVGEQEEKRAEQHSPQKGDTYTYDPFVEGAMPTPTGLTPKPPLFGPRSLKKKHGQKMSVSFASKPIPRSIPPQLRHTSVSTQAVGGPPLLSIVLDPPTDTDPRESEYFNSIGHNGLSLGFPMSPSTTSMVTPSMTTIGDSDSDDTIGRASSEATESPKSVRRLPPPPSRSSVVAVDAASPSTMTSSPFDEQDMISLLMSGSAPRRALPDPPRHYSHIDESVMPTPLSPRPRRDFSEQLRKMSVVSSVSSLYDEDSMADDPGAVSTGSPGRRSTLRSVKSPPLPPLPRADSATVVGSVGNSVAELRRMNSMISSYSVASVASSIYGEPESPTLPALRGGGFSPTRPNSKTDSIGRKNYLNLGSPPKSDGGAGRPPLPTSRSSRGGLGVEIREDDFDHGKENFGLDFKLPRLDISIPTGALREARRSSNLGRESLLTSMSKLGTVAEHQHDLERSSIDSSGIYDEEGFLKNSASDRDIKGLCLRM
ncbi:hypothetical protein G7Z17_g4986 [Cylindrodendrum hubeiense]|uniref:Uncharacterized protein n=1 Tax=Cylindrodendrum hubeiense TaxID=595255 RepID=A0A9P5L9H0_9HYPO|nr:hypothetical protein G7Z17_g4986 [Cylindrodendrum hubeiense]